MKSTLLAVSNMAVNIGDSAIYSISKSKQAHILAFIKANTSKWVSSDLI